MLYNFLHYILLLHKLLCEIRDPLRLRVKDERGDLAALFDMRSLTKLKSRENSTVCVTFVE